MGDILKVQCKDGSLSFKARIRRKGHSPIMQTFKRRTDAKNWIKQQESEILAGRQIGHRQRHKFSKVIARYLDEIMPDKKEGTKYVQIPMLHRLANYFKDTELHTIDYDSLIRARQYLQNEKVARKGQSTPVTRGNATINCYFALLRHVFSVAVRDWRWIDDNPVSRMRPLREGKGRVCSLTDEQMRTIVEALENHPREDFKLIVKIAMITGCRRGNAQTIQWHDIDFTNNTITFPDTKNNTPHIAPITPELAESLRAFQAKNRAFQGYAFPSADGSRIPFVDVKQTWRRFALSLGYEDLHFHDLRHAVASYLAKQNVSLLTIGKLLGHKSLESTKRYAHICVEDLQQHTKILGDRLNKKA